jgi:Ni/Fe-hydrogenase 1 B-type cytochrome subunit
MAVAADRYKGAGPPVREDVVHPARRAVYVWELPIRVVHWTIAFSIVFLCTTGLYLHHPFLDPGAGAAPLDPGYLLRTVRFIHEVVAFMFICALVVRIYMLFGGNRYASWRSLVPIRRWQRHDLKEMMQYYGLMRRHPPRFNGHNPLAGLAYIGFYMLVIFEIGSGLALFAWLLDKPPWTTLFGWQYHVWSIQWLRMWHFLLTFLFIVFAVHHIYSAILIDMEERNGELSSMFSGWKADVEHPDEPERTPRDDPRRAVLD